MMERRKASDCILGFMEGCMMFPMEKITMAQVDRTVSLQVMSFLRLLLTVSVFFCLFLTALLEAEEERPLKLTLKGSHGYEVSAASFS